jgi:hypothetical protein
MTRRTITFSLVLTLTLVVIGVSGASARPLDDPIAHMAKTAPAFGGMFIRDGVLNVYMTDRGASARAAATRALGQSFDRSRLPRTVRVLKARYSFARLERWQNRVTARLLGLPGVVMTDVDDTKNRLTVGVTSGRARSTVRARLAKLHVPREAVRIQAATGLDAQSSLNDFHRPLVGGLQIEFPRQIGNGFCTLGFNAVRNGVSGYLVNSHCTTIQGGIEGTIHYQPDQTSPANRIGVEVADPVYFRGGYCFPGLRCRFSDTAFFKRDAGVTASQGYIAKSDPSPSTGWNGDLYRITGKSNAIVGEFVEKVGRTTGRSGATVDRTCGNFLVNGTNISLLCQSTAQLFSLGGDSGSPVFTPSGSDVTVRGEVWGGNASTGETSFSPITSIQRPTEMGPISICAPSFSC